MTVFDPPSSDVSRGADVLRRLLRERTFDLRATDDAAGFRRWLERHADRWRRDPVFAARVRIAELRRSVPELLACEEAHRRAVAADAASATFAEFRRLDRELVGVERAIGSLSAALLDAAAVRHANLRRKGDEFLARREGILGERAVLTAASGERRTLREMEDRLRVLRDASGLTVAEEELRTLLRDRGRRGGRGGRSFEATAAEIVRRHVLPEVAARTDGVRLLCGVTLGAATVELDLVVVRTPRAAGEPVDVLAAVEAKRNVNDLARGFLRRQGDLAWLTGDPTGYDSAACRTRFHPTGHFERLALHEQDGEAFAFDRRSFRRFGRGRQAGLFLDRLYFVTRPGPVWGVSSAALSRIGHRVAFEGGPAADPERLRSWCRTLARPVETPDVLRLYASRPDETRRLLFTQE